MMRLYLEIVSQIPITDSLALCVAYIIRLLYAN